ncbi:MAG: hypothetical protein LBK59_04015, partial [Bifidobacteriaceae bacterium]|nr:hypothetical protein [Bifidobacteriaceae bacterium]
MATPTTVEATPGPVTTSPDAASFQASHTDLTVVSSGEIRLSDRLVDGELELGLRDITDPAATQWLDPAETVLYLPTRDSYWPGRSARGTTLNAWKAISAEGSLFWTTTTRDYPEWSGSSM